MACKRDGESCGSHMQVGARKNKVRMSVIELSAFTRQKIAKAPNKEITRARQRRRDYGIKSLHTTFE